MEWQQEVVARSAAPAALALVAPNCVLLVAAVSAAQVMVATVSAAQVMVAKVAAVQVMVATVSAAQVMVAKVAPAQVMVAKISTAQAMVLPGIRTQRRHHLHYVSVHAVLALLFDRAGGPLCR
mmetsp:Transcript_64946/g.145093  ORF Transcript_64946/g.145093 Transcript_64946/m.145093 type:complete len:123 (-) Transcript_64946:584-952(-)